ncbi:MAG: spore germination protein GerW family protein [Deltaproteobacteria bacterium]|nr:spore germination protein GerW family protein [Deltaproteobacteria bacterium]
MEEEKNTILNDFIPQLQNFVKSETVFGEPYHVGSVTLIPVNSVKVGFGFGSGELEKKNATSGGGGGGVLLTPVAFIVIKDEQVSIQNLSAGTIENIMEKTPEFLDRFSGVIQKLLKKNK